MTLTKRQVAELKKDLLQLKEQLKQNEVDDTLTMDTDEVKFGDQHIADYATELVDKQTQIAEDHLHDDQLRKVDEALERIEQGRYGVCIDTGEKIPFERLKAIPYAKRTVEAEEKKQDPPAANRDEDPTRLDKPHGEINDSRSRTLDKIEEEHK